MPLVPPHYSERSMLARAQASVRVARAQQVQRTRGAELVRRMQEERVGDPAAAMAPLGVQYVGGEDPCASITLSA